MANEKLLIELGEALRMIQNSKEDCPETSIKGRFVWETAHNCALSCLTNCPTVDTVEVVHGRWVNPYINRYGHPCHCCSVCGFKASYQDRNYCSNCGAKMDLKGD